MPVGTIAPSAARSATEIIGFNQRSFFERRIPAPTEIDGQAGLPTSSGITSPRSRLYSVFIVRPDYFPTRVGIQTSSQMSVEPIFIICDQPFTLPALWYTVARTTFNQVRGASLFKINKPHAGDMAILFTAYRPACRYGTGSAFAATSAG